MGAVELVCVGRLSRMGGESLLLPVWRSVGGGFTVLFFDLFSQVNGSDSFNVCSKKYKYGPYCGPELKLNITVLISHV